MLFCVMSCSIVVVVVVAVVVVVVVVVVGLSVVVFNVFESSGM